MGMTGWSTRPADQGTPAWEDRILALDPNGLANSPQRTRANIRQTQAQIRKKRTEAATVASAAAAREALATTPVSAAEVAGRYAAAARARTRARASVPPSIGRPGGGPSTAGGSAY